MSLRSLKTELARKLADIRRDEDFILGVIGSLKTENQIKKMIAYIESGEYDDEEVTVASIYIERGLI